jgi:hypothetical protein
LRQLFCLSRTLLYCSWKNVHFHFQCTYLFYIYVNGTKLNILFCALLLLFLFGSTGALTQGFMLAKQYSTTWATPPALVPYFCTPHYSFQDLSLWLCISLLCCF